MVSLKKNYLYSLIGQIVLFFVPLILVPYTSRTLGPENLGIYSYTYSIAMIFSTFGRLGINTYGKLQVAQKRDIRENLSPIIWELMSLKFILTLVEIVLYTAFILVFSAYRHASLIMILYLIADALDISWFYEGLERYKLLAVRRFAVNILHLALILLLVKGQDDFYLYALVMQGTTLVTNMALWRGMWKQVSYPKFMFNEHTLSHLRRCFVYFLPTIANLIYNMFDKVMLGFIGKSAIENGYYEQAYKIVSMAQTIVLQFGTVTLPRLTYLYSSDRNDEFFNIVRRTQRLSLLFLCPMSVGLFINSELIVTTVLGSSFLGSTNVLRVLSILLLFASLNYNIGNQILVATEKQKRYNIGVFIGACVNFICNLIFIRKYYAVGAAIGSLLAEIVIFVTFVAFSKSTVGIKTLFPITSMKYFVASLLMAICNIFLKRYLSCFSPIVRILVIICVCSTTYFVILLLLHEEEIIHLFVFFKRKVLSLFNREEKDSHKN